MYLEAIMAAVMLGQYVYHRLTAIDPPLPIVPVQIPQLADGTVVPILYGRVRSRQPVIAWYGNMTAKPSTYTAGIFFYEGDILFVIGIPFSDGTTKLQGIFVGEQRVHNLGRPNDLAPNLAAGPMPNVVNVLNSEDPQFTQIFYEFTDGNSAQNLLAGAGSYTAARMVVAGVDSADIPGYRGYAIVLCRMSRNAPNMPSITFELSTYPSPIMLTTPTIGAECNPMDVLYDLISRSYDAQGQLGKLGLTDAVIDVGFVDSTFQVCAETLRDEGHGYSRVIDARRSAGDVIEEICRQVDGVMYEDQASGKFKFKLIRADFDPDLILQLNPDNCEGLLDFAAAGWTNVVNKVRVVFTNRAADYADGSAVAHNQANAVGSDGEENEIVLHFPGCCTQELADVLAARELAARSRPMVKCRAVVDRSFYNVVPGDPIRVSWPEANINGMVFRVAKVSHSTADANVMILDLLQDYFFIHRNVVQGIVGSVGAFPGSAVAG